MDNLTIAQRIATLIKHFCKNNNTKFANTVGTSEANIRNYLSGTQPKFDVLNKIVIQYGISCEWLLVGEGEMLKKDNPTENSGIIRNQNESINSKELIIESMNIALKEKDVQIQDLQRELGKAEGRTEVMEQRISELKHCETYEHIKPKAKMLASIKAQYSTTPKDDDNE